MQNLISKILKKKNTIKVIQNYQKRKEKGKEIFHSTMTSIYFPKI